jgi:ribonuclease PH
MQRKDDRATDQLRKLRLTPEIAPNATGSVLIAMGDTQVICSAMIEEDVPRWMKVQGIEGGWVTAEYSMLPYSTNTRKARDTVKGRIDGRSMEIQRLIGRSLRAVIDLDALGPRTMWVDCDVLQADGGTRTASITGASIAMELAAKSLLKTGVIEKSPLKQRIAAVSVGILGGVPILDLDYLEDRDAAVDMNLVMTQDGNFVEVQGSGEEATFSTDELTAMLALGQSGISRLLDAQKEFIEDGNSIAE